MRRQFIMPEEDTTYLDSLGLAWETLKESNLEWLFVYDFPVPNGYTITKVAVAVAISSGYPIAALDMAYFYPSLIRVDGKEIKATNHIQQIDGKPWQRWSRHRTPQNPWQPESDNISTHFASIKYWLEREFK